MTGEAVSQPSFVPRAWGPGELLGRAVRFEPQAFHVVMLALSLCGGISLPH
jgi:hypothetical protein